MGHINTWNNEAVQSISVHSVFILYGGIRAKTTYIQIVRYVPTLQYVHDHAYVSWGALLLTADDLLGWSSYSVMMTELYIDTRSSRCAQDANFQAGLSIYGELRICTLVTILLISDETPLAC